MKAIWGVGSGAWVTALATVAALAACGDRASQAKTTGRSVLATFVAEVDTVAGAVTVTPIPGTGAAGALTSWSPFEAITVFQDGIPNNPAPNTVEFVNVGFATVAAGCTTADRFDARLQMNSGFAATRLEDAYVEILEVTSGFTSCWNAAAPTDSGFSEQYGLFSYGTVAPNGSATATWSFAVGTGASFTMRGRLWARTIEATPPATSGDLAAGSYPAPAALTLTCGDGSGSGCADTFYTVNGGSQVSYTEPIRLSGTEDVCYWSVDVAGNVEPQTCRHYVVTGSANTATYDATLHVPRCSALGSSCDTGAGTASIVYSCGNTGDVREPNQPPYPATPRSNTLDGCPDGDLFWYYGVDESLDRIVLHTLDNGPFVTGKTVRLEATVFAYDTNDYLDVFYATTTSSPTWHLLGSVRSTVTAPRPETLSYDFPLPIGAVAIRGKFSYGQQGTTCGSNYSDQDDLVFTSDALPLGSGLPTVSITSPAAGASLSRTVLVTVSATDPVGVASVELFSKPHATSSWTSRGIDKAAPWILSYDTTGDITSTDLKVRATDTQGRWRESAVVTVNVLDKTPPATTMTPPGTVTRGVASSLSATAIDPRLIQVVRFYVDGAEVGFTGTQSGANTFTVSWTPPAGYPIGDHLIWARATDFSGNVAQSAAVTFTVH